MEGNPNRMFLSAVKVARTNNLRPSAVIMHDHYALCRDWTTSKELEVFWHPIDYVLLEVAQMIEDYTDSQSGHFLKLEHSPSVQFKPVKKIRKSQAAIERIVNGKNYKPEPGEYYITEPVGKIPTWKEWFESMDTAGGSSQDDTGVEFSKFAHLADDAPDKRALPAGWDNTKTKEELGLV